MERTLFTLLAVATAVSGQLLQFGNGQLPACAQNCENLVNAQAACYPASPTPVLCFCQSAYLNTLKTTPEGTCDTTCTSETDRQQIFSWYAAYCANGGASASASLAAATGTASPSTLATQATAAGTSSATGATGTANADGTTSTNAVIANTDQNQSWWHLHARWIAMVIVLVVGFAIIIALGIWLKKRYLRKRDQTMLNGAPTGWAPPSKDQHAAGTYGRNNEKDASNTASKPSRSGKSKSGAMTKLQNLERKVAGR